MPQNQAQAGDKNAELQPPVKAAAVPVVHKAGEEAIVAGAAAAAAGLAPAANEERELGARGVPLGQRRPDDTLSKDEARGVNEREKESVERLERAEKERIEKEVQARVEKERLDREKRERLTREQELERVEKEKEKLAKEKAARETAEREQKERQEQERIEQVRREEEKLQQELQKIDSEIKIENRRVMEEAEQKARQAQQGRAKEQGENDIAEPQKKGGRDLKVRVEEGEEEEAAAAAAAHAAAQHSQEKDTDLRRRRRDVGPLNSLGAGGGMPGLEPLLELGGSDLHAALEGQLLGGAMVHSRQIKQTAGAEAEREI